MSSRAECRVVYTRTKTRVPAPLPELIERPRLIELLSAAPQAKLVLLHAPAGYGKTSLMQQWSARLAATGGAVAWFTPDERDRDAKVFLAYLLHAFEEAGHLSSEPLRGQLTADSYYSWRIIATQLANSFVDAAAPLYLFIDELQHLRDSEALECLRYLLESTPAELRFVLASREDPGIPLGRLRALGRILELRAADLRFGGGETAAYFATRGHAQLTPEQLAALETRAEGWIVGLKLLSMAMQWSGAEALNGSLLSGERVEIADFFAEDVLARQPAEVRDFLLRSCVLERLCPALCDSLPGVQGSRALIDRCAAGGLFLIALDSTRHWYRYHSLFADFLRRQLNDRHPGLADELYVAASAWLQQAGFHGEAFDYALKGNSPIRAAQILDARCDTMWSEGRQQMIQALAERLPPHVQALYPRIMLALAWRLVAQWKVDQAQQLIAVTRARLAEMERGCTDPTAFRNLRHRVLHRESQIAQTLYQIETVERLSRQLLEENAGAENDPYLQASVLITLQYAQREQFQLGAVQRLTEQAHEAMERTGFSHGVVFLSAACGPSYALAGRVGLALRLLRRGVEIARGLTGSGSALGAIAGLHLASLLYDCNDIAGATELMTEYFRNEPVVGTPDHLVAGWLTAARLARARGNLAESLEVLQNASDFAERHSTVQLKRVAAAESVRVLLKMGRPDDAAQYARRVGLARALEQSTARGCLNTADSAQAQAWCRLVASQDKLAEALAVARRWRAHVTTADAVQSAVEWGITVTELLLLGGDRKAAQRSLSQALLLAGKAGFVRAFLDEGEPIGRLLEQMAGGERTAGSDGDAFLCALVDEFRKQHGGPVPPEPVPAEKVTLVGRLSTRELEILVLAGAGMLNKRISEKLGLTEGTVKWYLQQVFDKLGVRDRVRAATKARQLGLIN